MVVVQAAILALSASACARGTALDAYIKVTRIYRQSTAPDVRVVEIVNISAREMTAFGVSVTYTYPDGTTRPGGAIRDIASPLADEASWKAAKLLVTPSSGVTFRPGETQTFTFIPPAVPRNAGPAKLTAVPILVMFDDNTAFGSDGEIANIFRARQDAAAVEQQVADVIDEASRAADPAAVFQRRIKDLAARRADAGSTRSMKSGGAVVTVTAVDQSAAAEHKLRKVEKALVGASSQTIARVGAVHRAKAAYFRAHSARRVQP